MVRGVVLRVPRMCSRRGSFKRCVCALSLRDFIEHAGDFKVVDLIKSPRGRERSYSLSAMW